MKLYDIFNNVDLKNEEALLYNRLLFFRLNSISSENYIDVFM